MTQSAITVGLRRPLSLLVLLACAACGRPAPSASIDVDAAGPRDLAVRVPAALRLARALDTLSVSVDPAALATTKVSVDAAMFVGVEIRSYVFPMGGARPARARIGLSSGPDFGGDLSTWSTKADGLPVPGTRYVVEMELVLFETDVPPGPTWDPRAGRYKALWTRTLHQNEE